MVHSRPELIVLTRLAADLMNWIDCSWIIGLVGAGREIRVVCVMGKPPDVSRCLECVRENLQSPTEMERGLAPLGKTAASTIPKLVARVPNVQGLAPVLAIGPKNGCGDYSLRDRELVRDLCISIADLLKNARLAQAMSAEFIESDRIRADYEAAQELQDRFLPCDTAPVQGVEYFGSSQRCGALGGDFFGFLSPHPTQLVMTIGRVAPAGSPAALLAAGLQAKLRTLVEYVSDLTRVMQDLNRMMWEVSPGDVFSNLLCARVDPSQHKLEYICAGQEAAFLVRAQSLRVEPLESCGAVLGLSRRSSYSKRIVTLDPGDLLVAITDGIADATAQGDMHFIEALPNLLRELSKVGVRDLADNVLNAVQLFTGRHAEAADRTTTVIRVNDRAKTCVDEIRIPSYRGAAVAA